MRWFQFFNYAAQASQQPGKPALQLREILIYGAQSSHITGVKPAEFPYFFKPAGIFLTRRGKSVLDTCTKTFLKMFHHNGLRRQALFIFLFQIAFQQLYLRYKPPVPRGRLLKMPHEQLHDFIQAPAAVDSDRVYMPEQRGRARPPRGFSPA